MFLAAILKDHADAAEPISKPLSHEETVAADTAVEAPLRGTQPLSPSSPRVLPTRSRWVQEIPR
jgi:hypothetical protein